MLYCMHGWGLDWGCGGSGASGEEPKPCKEDDSERRDGGYAGGRAESFVCGVDKGKKKS